MAKVEFLFQSAAGVRHGWREHADGTVDFVSQQDVTPILEQNKAMQRHNDGYSQSRELARVASIPVSIMYKWLVEEGWNAWDTADPDVQRKLNQKLDSNEFRYLRTSEIILGDSWRKTI
jgi:hypothetical protein